MGAILLSGVTFVSTCLGGLAALKIRDKLHLLIGLSAGALIGAAMFDLAPEWVDLISKGKIEMTGATVFVVLGFLSFFLLERFTALHGSHTHDAHADQPHPSEVGLVAAAGLTVHSFLDGVAIGVGFKVGAALGVLIALAVIAHDFADGLNTVTVVLAHRNSSRRAVAWLLADALAPVAGAVVATGLPIPEVVIGYLVSSFIGVFLYLGASDLLPEAREHESIWPTAAVLVGVLLMFAATRFV